MSIRRSSTALIIASVGVVTVVSGGVLWSAQSRARAGTGPGALQTTSRAFPNEQAWILASVASAIAQMAQYPSSSAGEAPTSKLEIQDHIWSPATYAPLADALFAGRQSGTDVDLDARTPLARLTVDVLLDQNERLSAMLGRDMRSAAAHESAALLVAAHALREAPGMFADVRPALSRMAAHLAVADALRHRSARSLDGALAHAVLTTLVGRQRSALAELEAIERRVSTVHDRAWLRALRLRVTGDWRTPLAADATVLERLEFARALRMRAGSDRLLEFLDDPAIDEAQTDWHRIALAEGFNLVVGARFTDDIAARELAEAGRVWTRLHGRRAEPTELTAALNDRPENGPILRTDSGGQVRIVGWGDWAAFEQRQLSHALTARSRHLYNRSSQSEQETLVNDVRAKFSSLTLYPVVLRWLSLTPADYENGMAGARRLARDTPQLITAAAWNLLAEKPPFVREASPFPFVQTWFEPAVPLGTAFDLYARALLPGCPRPPSARQARQWADEAPYDHWVRWSADWLAVTGKPKLADVRRSFGQLQEYDYSASMKLIDYMDMSAAERIEIARQLCAIAIGRCDVLAELLVRDGRDAEAVMEIERWIGNSRDSVKVSNHVTWLVRHYQRTGHIARAEEVARVAASTSSYAGLDTYAHLLDVQGRYEEAESFYVKIADRYENTTPLGTFMIRQAQRNKDRVLELRGWDLVRSEFPGGLERMELHALDVPPRDGMVFRTFGRRAASAGLRHDDIVVGLDDWRVRDHRQYSVIARLRHDDAMTFVVWREARYQQVRARLPERWLGLQLASHLGARSGG